MPPPLAATGMASSFAVGAYYNNALRTLLRWADNSPNLSILAVCQFVVDHPCRGRGLS